MGLFDSIKEGVRGQLLNVVEWADMDDESIFYKWNNEEIKKGSKLIIRPAQDAIFLYQGRIEGIFTEEGEYDIQSQIIPFLSTLKGWKFGFDSGLRAEVLFVNTREFVVNWGTQNALNLPVQGLPGGMPIRAFGTFTCKAGDYTVLVDKVAGVQKRYTIQDIKHRISAINDQLLMKFILQDGKDMFNIQANAYDISKDITAALDAEFSQFGMSCTNYTIQSVSYPDSVREMQEKAAGASMVSDAQHYTQVQFANNLGNENGGGSTASDMAQMAAGLVMGQQLAGAFNGANNAVQQAAAPVQQAAAEVRDAVEEVGGAAADAEENLVRFCPFCGKKLQIPGAKFCPFCGKQIG